MDKNPLADAGGHGFDTCSGKIPHAEEPLSPCTQPQSPRTATTEALAPEPALRSKRRHHNKSKPSYKDSLLFSAAGESPCKAAKTQRSQNK